MFEMARTLPYYRLPLGVQAGSARIAGCVLEGLRN
jgi:hypothetical protein